MAGKRGRDADNGQFIPVAVAIALKDRAIGNREKAQVTRQRSLRRGPPFERTAASSCKVS